MSSKAVVSLTTGLEDPEKVTVAFLVALGAAEQRRPHASAGPLQKVIELAGAEAVRQVMRDVLEADRKPDGQLRQDNVFRYVLAIR